MADYDDDDDRGAYTPSGDAPLSFDARNSGSRGAGRPPTTLIISAIILVVLMVAMFFLYRQGLRKEGEPPVVGAPLGSLTQAPSASSQPPSDASAGLEIYKSEEAPTTTPAPTFAPEPERPLPRPTPAPSKPVTAPASLPPASAAPAVEHKPAPASTPSKPPAAAAVTPVTPKPATAAAKSTSSSAVVQIGALSSPSLADKAWNDVARMMPGDMVGKTKRVEPITTDGGTKYRAYVGGFSSKAEASSFCASLKGHGKDCIVR